MGPLLNFFPGPFRHSSPPLVRVNVPSPILVPQKHILPSTTAHTAVFVNLQCCLRCLSHRAYSREQTFTLTANIFIHGLCSGVHPMGERSRNLHHSHFREEKKKFVGGRRNFYYMIHLIHRHSFLAFPLVATFHVLKITSSPLRKLKI